MSETICVDNIYSCRNEIFGIFLPKMSKLWKKDANFIEYCDAGIPELLNRVPPYNPYTCFPSLNKTENICEFPKFG